MKKLFVFFLIIALASGFAACNQNEQIPTATKKIYNGTWDGSYFELIIEEDFASMILPHTEELTESTLTEMGIADTVTIETKAVDEALVTRNDDGTVTLLAISHWRMKTISGTGAEAYCAYKQNHYRQLHAEGNISDESLEEYLKEYSGQRYHEVTLPREDLAKAEVTISLDEENKVFTILSCCYYDLEGNILDQYIYEDGKAIRPE